MLNCHYIYFFRWDIIEPILHQFNAEKEKNGKNKYAKKKSENIKQKEKKKKKNKSVNEKRKKKLYIEDSDFRLHW